MLSKKETIGSVLQHIDKLFTDYVNSKDGDMAPLAEAQVIIKALLHDEASYKEIFCVDCALREDCNLELNKLQTSEDVKNGI